MQTKRNPRFGHIVLIAVTAAAVGASCSTGPLGKEKQESKGNQGSSGSPSGSEVYVSSYDWARISNTKLPKVAEQKASASFNLQSSNKERCQSSEAKSFRKRFENLLEQALAVPEVKLCDGSEIVVGKAYRQVPKGTKESQYKRFSVMKFEERADLGVVHQYCHNSYYSATTYKFGEGDSFRSEYIGRYAEFQGENVSYSLFDKQLTNPQELLSSYVSKSPQSTNSFRSVYGPDGSGEAQSYSLEDNTRYARGIKFTDLGGFSKVLHADENEERQWLEFFNNEGYKLSSIELALAGFDLSDVDALTLPQSKEDAVFSLPEYATEMSCGEEIITVECGLETETDKASEGTGANEGMMDCSEMHNVEKDNRYHIHMKDPLDYTDTFLKAELSLKKLGDMDRYPRQGEIFGLNVRLEKSDGTTQDISDHAVVDFDKASFQVVEVPADCPETLEANALGVAFSHNEICALAKEYPLLLKIVASDLSKAHPLSVEIFEHSGSISLNIDGKLPTKLLLVEQGAAVPAAACSDLSHPNNTKRVNQISLKRKEKNSAIADLYACMSDGSLAQFNFDAFTWSGVNATPFSSYSVNLLAPGPITGTITATVKSRNEPKLAPRFYLFETFEITLVDVD